MTDELIERIKADREAAMEWAHKVSKSKPPRYTDASRNAALAVLADAKIIEAASTYITALEASENATWTSSRDIVGLDVLDAAYRAALEARK